MYTNDKLELIDSYKDEFGKSIMDKVGSVREFYDSYNKKYDNYSKNYARIMENAFNSFNINHYVIKKIDGSLSERTFYSENLDKISNVLDEYLNKLNNLKYLSFLSEENRNVVFVGPNGCGKTTLLRYLRKTIGENYVSYYQADRLLLVNNNYAPERNEDKFNKTIIQNKKYANDINNDVLHAYISKELDLAIAQFEKKRAQELEMINSKEISRKNCKTNIILDLWNELVSDRTLFCRGDLRIKTKDKEEEYPLNYMSSGEKSLFFFLSSIILNERKEYYFIDEPENSLNPAVVAKLWDKLENYYPDSIFVYLTHDCNFAASRNNCSIYWIRKYNGNNNRDFYPSDLSENDIFPKDLLVSMIGSGRPILFCESEDMNKYDAKVFELMFPEFKIIPAKGRKGVVAKSKAYNKLNLPQEAFGIIDCDYNDDQFLEGQKNHNVFFLPFFEIENFLISEEVLSSVIKNHKNNKSNIFEKIKAEIKDDFKNSKELWIIRKTGFKLKNEIFNYDINSIQDFSCLKDSFNKYLTRNNLDAHYNEYSKFFDQVINRNDYNEILKYYDNKNNLFNIINNKMSSQSNFDYETELFNYLKSQKGTELLKKLRNKYFADISIST